MKKELFYGVTCFADGFGTALSPSGKPQICFFCLSKKNKREKAEKAGKLQHSQAGPTAIKREKHEKQRAVFLMGGRKCGEVGYRRVNTSE